MGVSSLTVPKEYELVASFNRELCATLSDSQNGKKRFDLEFYFNTLKSQHDCATANIIAISTALECRIEELGMPSRCKEWAQLKTLSKSVQRGALSETGYRKRCSTGTLIAIWSWDTVAHYRWHEMGTKSLASLVKLAKKYPKWDVFVDVANSCMITRHEDSVHNAEISSIGFHDPRSATNSTRSPLEPRDITSLLDGTNEFLTRQSQHRIQCWTRPCKCLAVRGCRISDEQLSKRTLTYDAFGMLVKSDAPFKRYECSRLCERPPAGTTGKRPVKQSMNGAVPLKQPKVGTLTVPKPRDENCGSAHSDDNGSGHPRAMSGDTNVTQSAEELATSSGTQRPQPDDDAVHNGAASRRAPCQADCESPESEDSSTAPSASTLQVSALTGTASYGRKPTSLAPLSGPHGDAMLPVEVNAQAGTASAFGPCSQAYGWRPLARGQSDLQPVQGSTTFLPEFYCPQCSSSVCDKCIIPEQFGAVEAMQRCKIAHDVDNLPKSQKAGQIQDWISPIRFARLHYSDDLLPHVNASQIPVEEADACVWSWKHFKDLANAHASFSKPIIIKQGPTDTCYNLQWFLRRLQVTYAGKSLSVKKGRDKAPKRVAVETLVHLMRSDKPTPINVLSLDDITFAAKPDFTRLDRFTLLQRLISRARLDLSDDPSLAQKSVRSMACDVESCTHFNILASRGAFSPPHRDSTGGTWIHLLFGSKLWWISAPLAETDAEQLHGQLEKGRPWHPQARERALILSANDILVMPHEYPVVHAVLTLEPTLAHGGTFWDDEHIESVLKLLIQNAKGRNCTNEPMPFQLPTIIHALHELTCHKEAIPDTNDHGSVRALIAQFNALKCDCHTTFGSCEQDKCPCFADGRRCWSLCGSHPKLYEKDWCCMSEDP